MKTKKRQKIHPAYYRIKGYQILESVSDSMIAKELGVSVRTFRDKREGYSDFTLSQSEVLSRVLKRPKEEIFLTADVSKATQNKQEVIF